MVSDYDLKYGQRVEFRVNPDVDQVRVDFFKNIDRLHTDRCYILTSLMKAWNLAVSAIPDPDAKVNVATPGQSIQINIGCNFHYHTKKARRTLPTSRLPEMEMRKNTFFPLLLEEWPTLREDQKAFWRQQLINAGIMPPLEQTQPPASTGKRKSIFTFFKRLLSIVRQLSGKGRHGRE